MQVIFKKIRTFCIVAVLSVSLTVSNTAAVTYQAAAIPVVYTGWQTLVTILALLGITICAAPDISEDEAAQELIDKFVGWKVLKGEGQGDNDGDGEDDLFSTFDPLNYLNSSNQLYLDQDDLEAWQNFVREQGWTDAYDPVSDVNLYGASLDDFSHFLCDIADIDYNSNSFGVSYLNSFVNSVYDNFVEHNYSCIIWPNNPRAAGGVAMYYYGLDDDLNRFQEESADLPENIYFYNGTKLGASFNSVLFSLSYNSGSEFINYFKYSSSGWKKPISYGSDVILIINGKQYDLYSICSKPINLSTSIDYGSSFALSDFGVPTNHFGDSISDFANSFGSLELGSLIKSGDFDVVGNGRQWDDDKQEAVGDITVPMPSVETITAFSNGEIAYEDMLNEMEVTPIDESTGTNLLTQEFLTTQTGIFNGVTSILDLLQQIVAWLNNLIDSIVQAFIDMLLSLFVPSDGFIDGKIDEIQSKLDSLGVVPYDMSGIFDSDDGNPFKNITIDVNGQEVVIVSFDFLPPFLDKFRPVIRGLLVLLLVYYSINQLLSLIRLSGMMEGGNINQLSIQGSTVPRIEDKGGRL